MTASCKVLNAALGLLSPTMLVLWIIIRLSSFQSIYHYRYLNELLYETFMRVFLFFFEFLTTKKVRNAFKELKIQIFIYGDTEYFKTSEEKVIYIANHLSTADWFICSMLIARQGNVGRTRYVMHKNLKYIPIFGFYLAQDSCVYVDRSNFQANKAINVIREIIKMKSKVWMMIYPEGRRYNPEHLDVIEKSKEFAKSKNVEPYRHHLVPRVRGFQLLMDHLSQYVDAVYDVSVVYADADGRPLDHRRRVPQLTNWLPDQHTFHIHITRIPIHAMPKEPSQLQSWLFNRFRIKDKLVENIQNRFYPDNDKNEITLNSYSHISTQNNVHRTAQELQFNSNDIVTEIVKCIPEELGRNVIQLDTLKLYELLPSVLFFYGLTFYWIFGFGWYGPISFLLVAIFGSVLGEIYVHYFV
ncbi:hypothetical protein P879_02554 [Paragonimus westermani]|uniref:Phospholipid/glycerol acyltransferase domain-containing protein n=1 Tax=Paragonimus westermani TaxID=34504 RepID=A0A8T0DGJ8_9TREM|nr:hypothetical protein P879_02554 [Paragonimus westermani]